MNWANKTTVIKGDFAEDIVAKYLLEKGLIPYKPHFDGAHPFDFLCATTDKKNMVIVDSKAKAAMNYKQNGYYRTGIDTKHYNEYANLGKKYNLPIWLFFVDEEIGFIYGNVLSSLDRNAITKYSKRLFILDEMKVVYQLNEEQIHFLKSNSTRNHEYINTADKIDCLLNSRMVA